MLQTAVIPDLHSLRTPRPTDSTSGGTDIQAKSEWNGKVGTHQPAVAVPASRRGLAIHLLFISTQMNFPNLLLVNPLCKV